MDFKNTNCQDFLDMLASKAPVPGGGGACALVGALGIALGHMTGALTEGKKRYIEFAPELKLLQTELQQLQEELKTLKLSNLWRQLIDFPKILKKKDYTRKLLWKKLFTRPV